MILLPAVDIRHGRAVRLERGDFERETVSGDPVAAARDFVEAGASWLHVVDLDGALAGEPVSLPHLERIAGDLGVPVQYGGGLRSRASVERAISAGASRVVIGTAAYADPELLDSVLSTWPDRVAVSLDARGGSVSVAGWTEQTADRPEEVVGQLVERGITRVIYTNVDRDGMLSGGDLDGVAQVAGALEAGLPGGRLLYSGGVGSVEDLAALRELGLASLEGVISGKALYERRFTVAEGRAALGEESWRGR